MDDHATLQMRIERSLETLGPAGRRVAAALLTEFGRLGHLTSADLGRLADTTDATVVRTVQRLGYDGLRDLKRSIADELDGGDVVSRFRSGLDAPTTPALEAQLVVAAHAIDGLAEPSITASVLAASELLDSAAGIVVAAAGPTAAIGEYAVAQWRRIGLEARAAVGPAGPGPDDLAGIADDDVVVMIASGRPRRWATALADEIRRRRLIAVVLTDALPAPSTSAVMIRSGRGPANRPATHVATIAVIEALTARVAEAAPERTEQALARLARLRRALVQ